MSGYRKDEYNWRYDSDELPDDIVRTSAALENLQLDRKARNLTTSWRFVFLKLRINFCLFSLMIFSEVIVGKWEVQQKTLAKVNRNECSYKTNKTVQYVPS